MEDYESILLVKNEVYVYKIPPRATNRGYRAADWKLDAPEWTGRMRLVTKGKDCTLKLEDKISGELFAKCPIDKYPGIAVEAVVDSSRYFVIRLQDDSGRAAFIGIGFADRGDSFDLNVALQDHFKYDTFLHSLDFNAQPESMLDRCSKLEKGRYYANRHEQWIKRWLEKSEELEKGGTDPDQPQLDLSFKEGQTIKINMNIGRKSSSGKPKPKPSLVGTGGLGLLPPPPGGVKVPPSAPPGSGARPPPCSPAAAQPSPAPHGVQQHGVANLLDLSPPKEGATPSAALVAGDAAVDNGVPAASSVDPWGDFASAAGPPGNFAPPVQPSPGGAWIQF